MRKTIVQIEFYTAGGQRKIYFFPRKVRLQVVQFMAARTLGPMKNIILWYYKEGGLKSPWIMINNQDDVDTAIDHLIDNWNGGFCPIISVHGEREDDIYFRDGKAHYISDDGPFEMIEPEEREMDEEEKKKAEECRLLRAEIEQKMVAAYTIVLKRQSLLNQLSGWTEQDEKDLDGVIEKAEEEIAQLRVEWENAERFVQEKNEKEKEELKQKDDIKIELTEDKKVSRCREWVDSLRDDWEMVEEEEWKEESEKEEERESSGEKIVGKVNWTREIRREARLRCNAQESEEEADSDWEREEGEKKGEFCSEDEEWVMRAALDSDGEEERKKKRDYNAVNYRAAEEDSSDLAAYSLSVLESLSPDALATRITSMKAKIVACNRVLARMEAFQKKRENNLEKMETFQTEKERKQDAKMKAKALEMRTREAYKSFSDECKKFLKS